MELKLLIGKLKIVKLDNVEIMFDKNSGEVQVKGPKGVLRDTFLNGFNLIQDDKVLHVEIEKKDDSNVEKASAFQGLYRALLQNMIDGVRMGKTAVSCLEFVRGIVAFLSCLGFW